MVKIGLKTEIPPAYQTTIGFSQINPGSGTQYEALATQAYARIIGLSAYVVWSVQPTPLEVWVNCDGVTICFSKGSPATATSYFASFDAVNPDNAQPLITTDYTDRRPFLLEGRQVRVLVEITGGTVTLLGCIIRWSRW